MQVAFGCCGNTIKLRSGRYLDLNDPLPDQFTFADIAGALSKICRFGGQIPRWYSVAEHCWHCAIQAADDGHIPKIQAALLMHDAAEAFLGDVVKPLKIMLSDYSLIESKFEAVISDKFGINFDSHGGIISQIDHEILLAERNAIFGPDGHRWPGEGQVRNLYLRPRYWDPQMAEGHFVALAAQVGIDVRR